MVEAVATDWCSRADVIVFQVASHSSGRWVHVKFAR